ncbi:MAG: Nucleotide sugar dehydrogenase [Candidatus Collierbacteria bacterium GW2011_GWD2_45_10]|nr:MAG: Nucleotide sugar dehydrogenase [Candidatus Collierbacteria bacterium GW2011_GWA2_44_13]KKT88146.1 MAG: Nucleotide sugar dehydrogenase [Candidatus Collierbacteria bacterium GW2011_GWD2_45_10]
MLGITPKQKQILDYIEEYYQNNKFSPTLEEIAKKFKRSVPTIHQYVKSLIDKGRLQQNSGARGIMPITQSANMKAKRSFRIGIIGYGFVGQAVEYGFSNHEIHIYDKYKDFESLPEVVEKSDYIFVCLPTPIKDDESGIDLSIMDENIKELTKLTKGTDKIIIIKSTVVPGTTTGYIKKYPKSLICFNPEFLREASFLQDFVNTDRIVIGAVNDQVSRRVSAMYQAVLPLAPIFQTDPTSAEMVKYMANCFLATKVIFANEMTEICEKLGINYPEVKKMVVADKRILDGHLDITTLRGFGGKCFPKDLLALRAMASGKGVDTKILDAVWAKNLKVRKVKDWEEIPFAVSPAFGNRS